MIASRKWMPAQKWSWMPAEKWLLWAFYKYKYQWFCNAKEWVRGRLSQLQRYQMWGSNRASTRFYEMITTLWLEYSVVRPPRQGQEKYWSAKCGVHLWESQPRCSVPAIYPQDPRRSTKIRLQAGRSIPSYRILVGAKVSSFSFWSSLNGIISWTWLYSTTLTQ